MKRLFPDRHTNTVTFCLNNDEYTLYKERYRLSTSLSSADRAKTFLRGADPNGLPQVGELHMRHSRVDQAAVEEAGRSSGRA